MTMTIRRIAALAGTVFAVACVDAQAATPDLLSVDQQDRHSTGTFSAPGADSATVYIATKPDRGSDGRFLSENVVDYVFLTDDEIAAGSWLSSGQLDPGSYYVMLNADDYDCYDDPACLEGFSGILPLTVPKPAQTFTRKVTRPFQTLYLKLTIAPLGDDQPYRLCWPKADGRRRCLRSTVDGYDWNEAASDEVSVGARAQRAMRSRTTFSWYVAGERVASKSVRIRRHGW
jgi:hypothetical protein